MSRGEPGSVAERSVALAFEAGEDAEPFVAILDSLRAAEVRVTVFLDGVWAERNPDLVRRAVEEGHELGNHGYGHPDWTDLTDDEIRQDLGHVERIVAELASAVPKPWALPPLLGFDERVDAVLRGSGYRAINLYPIDGNAYPDVSANGIRERAVALAASEPVITIHTGRTASADAVPAIIDELAAQGCSVTRISDLDSVPDYPPVTPPRP